MNWRLFELLTKILAGVVGVLGTIIQLSQFLEPRPHVSLFESPTNRELFLVLIAVLAVEVCSLFLIHLKAPADPGRRRGLYCMSLCLLIPPFLWASRTWTHPDSEALSKQLRSHCWVGYDPLDFDPVSRPSPTVEAMRRDLRWIRQAGFTGIVTFGSTGSLGEIPAIAHAEGLAVIMGVWSPNDRQELAAAVKSKDVVLGYSVGHDRLGFGYTLSELTAAVRFLRGVTALPVTTTENLKDYDAPGEPRLAPVSDWLFPDVHLSLLDANGVLSEERIPAYVQEVMERVAKTELLARRLHRPLMLKMLVFPHGGAAGASPELQRIFFRQMFARFHDSSSGLRTESAFMVHSAFDAPWKRYSPYPWDPYTGLFSNFGDQLPVVHEVIRQWQ